MRYVGIDIASEEHVVAVVGDEEQVLLRPTTFTEDAEGYKRLFQILGEPGDTMVAMEATGHYWKNIFAALVSRGFQVALLNPLRTRRFAEEDLARTKTDAIDALGIARFVAQKHPEPTRLPDAATEELRELVRHRDRLVQDFGDRTRQLHRLVDLGFPEFTKYVAKLDTQLATSVLKEFPTAKAFDRVTAKRLSRHVYDGRHRVGDELASALIAAAKASVGSHHGYAYQVQVRHTCEDMDLLRGRIRDLENDIDRQLQAHEVGKLLTTITGIGPQTVARIIAEVGNPAEFKSPGALAAYLGLVPALKQSGKNKSTRATLCRIGNAHLRGKLWMPTLNAVVRNPWLRAYYRRLRGQGKPAKLALIAAMRKLITAIYSVAKNRRAFVPHVTQAGASA
jgi:transposase